jgi:hypothetical protein
MKKKKKRALEERGRCGDRKKEHHGNTFKSCSTTGSANAIVLPDPVRDLTTMSLPFMRALNVLICAYTETVSSSAT